MCAWCAYVCIVMHVCVVMHVHVGMHVCVTHTCVWSDVCIMVHASIVMHASMCGACMCVTHAYVWQCMLCVDAHVCTCTHLLDRLISDILYGPLPLRSLIELHTGSAS